MAKREGECTRCGKCCNANAQKIDNLVIRGQTSKANGDCSFLVHANGGTSCAIYGDRPGFCRNYPREPAHLIKGCGFYFVEG